MAEVLTDILRVGLVGAGMIGEAHAGAVAHTDGQEVVAVAEPVGRLCEEFAARYSIPRAYASWEDLIKDPEVDIVYIGTPNDLHLPIAVAAMEAGKHVVCEKPLARNVAEGRAMLAKAEQTGRMLFIALNHRFSPANQKVKELIAGGAIGRPFIVLSTFIGNEFDRMSDPGSWKGTPDRCGGGVLIDNGTHMIDLLRWWFGEAAAVSASMGKLAVATEGKAEDTAAVAIAFRSGVLAELSLTFGARYSVWPKGYVGAAVRTEIFGLEGSIKVSNDGAALQMVGRGDTRIALDPSDISTDMPTSLHAHYADCIRGTARPLVTAEDGLAALEIVEACYRSSREGLRVEL